MYLTIYCIGLFLGFLAIFIADVFEYENFFFKRDERIAEIIAVILWPAMLFGLAIIATLVLLIYAIRKSYNYLVKYMAKQVLKWGINYGRN